MERGAFDVRVWVEGEDGRDVYRRMKNLFEEMQELAYLEHEGCDVRYHQIRPRKRSRSPEFEVTLPWTKAEKEAARRRGESGDFSRPAVPSSNPET